jgi:NTE family protein
MRSCTCTTGGELGVALAGGGARAVAQLGVLKVLDRAGIPVSYVAGTSAGAVIGAVYATSDTAGQAEERVLAHLATKGIGFNVETFDAIATSNARRPTGFIGMLGTLRCAARPGGGLIGGDAMRASLHQLFGDAAFADTRVPLATTALDLISGRRVIFADGPLVDAVYASSAIPGLFEPFHVHDHVLMDGGWAEPVPVSSATTSARSMSWPSTSPSAAGTRPRAARCRPRCWPMPWHGSSSRSDWSRKPISWCGHRRR